MKNKCGCKCTKCCSEPKQIHWALLPIEERHDGKIYLISDNIIPGGATIIVHNNGALHIEMNEYSRW